MKITVIGPGAIGTLLATLLSNTNVEISLLVKPKHKELLQDGKIILNNFNGRRLEKKITIVTELDNPEWIILAVKSYDVDSLIELLGNSNAPILCCQNGIKTYLQLTKKIGKDRIAYMVTGIGSSKIETGEAEFRGSGFTFIGEASGIASTRLINLSKLIRTSGITCEVVNDVLSYVWLKTIINSSINPVAAYAKVINGDLRRPELNKIVRKICIESTKISTEIGINLPLEPWSEIEKIIRNTAENKCSMLQDLENRRQTEIDAINGEIARIADSNGLDATYNKEYIEKIKSVSN
uniref:2-dehydropantoate 2-reductase n=1 Tax=uncultured marine group II/III euryarchaeote AD1000_21_F10 TaxID=1457736 RepID=A0A075FS57_9EURY|nr:2-dehydropantoate 2-reductase (panE, apbA) [uncultured marine group II/III euryarchaeote AD1000_21_F10]